MPQPSTLAIPETEPLRLAFGSKQARRKKFSETCRVGCVRLRKRADSGIWYANYTQPRTGKNTGRTLGTTLKKEALREAENLSEQLHNHKIGVIDGSVPLSVLFDEYFRAISGRKAAETLKRIASSRHMFERWLADLHPNAKYIKHITISIVREFQEYRAVNGNVAKRTVDNDISNLHTVFKWGEREKLVCKSPFDYSRNGNVDLYNEPQQENDTYTEDEYRRLVSEAERSGDFLVRDIIVVLADTGMRFGELANLTPEALHWDTDIPYIDIRARNGWKPKDPKERKRIPMTETVQEVLKRREPVNQNGLIFTNRAGKIIAENHTRDRLKALFPAVGITTGRRLHWHSWRNHFVLRCLNAGIAVHHIMRWTGHDSVGMVLHYAETKISDTMAFGEFSKFPSRQNDAIASHNKA